MKDIVIVCLAIDAKTGALVPEAPFLVKASRVDRSGVYDREPEMQPSSRNRVRPSHRESA